VVGRQPYAPATFTPGEIPGTHFQEQSQPRGTWFRRWEPRKKSRVTPPKIDTGTVRLVTQCSNHYATPLLRCNAVYFGTAVQTFKTYLLSSSSGQKICLENGGSFFL